MTEIRPGHVNHFVVSVRQLARHVRGAVRDWYDECGFELRPAGGVPPPTRPPYEIESVDVTAVLRRGGVLDIQVTVAVVDHTAGHNQRATLTYGDRIQ